MKRTVFALVISITGVFLSHYFLFPNNDESTSKSKLIAMAKVLAVVNDVKKQAVNKFIWEPVRKGDVLYLGEKLKTSAQSNSKIEFLENGASIDIEPESLIVVNKNNQKLSLQVVEGSLFVSSKSDLSNLSVTSGDKNENAINIKNGDVAYSVNKDGKTDVDFVKGNNNEDNLKSGKNKFKDIKPEYGETLYVNTDSDEELIFKWAPLNENFGIKFEFGSNRNNLSLKNDFNLDLANGFLKTKPMIGTFYWRLIAENRSNPNEKYYSSIFKVTYKQKLPPTLIYPLNNELVQIKTINDNIDFKWNTLQPFDNLKIEIFKEENKQTPLISTDVTNLNELPINKINKPGRYQWRLIGKTNGSDKELLSQFQKFQMIVGDDMQSPIPLSPEDKSTIYFSKKKSLTATNVHLNWKSVSEAREYKLQITNKDNKTLEFKVSTNEFIIPKLSEGSYLWTVQSINQKREASKETLPRTFNVAPMQVFAFKPIPAKIFYNNTFPLHKFDWNQLASTAQYKLKISQSQSMSPSEEMKTKDNFFNYQIGKEGIYYIQIEALNKDDNSFGETDIETFTVSKPTLPPAPILNDSKKVIEASLNGDITFELMNYEKRFTAFYEIKDSKGIVISQLKSNSAQATFKSLSPGNFVVVVKYVDDFNQTSESTERLNFIVPDKSAIAAPKVKGVKIR